MTCPDDGELLADPVWPVLTSLRDCLEDLLPCTPLGPVCRLLVEQGAAAWAACGATATANGEGWVREVRRFPTVRFPAQDSAIQTCATRMAVDIEVGVVRCAPQLTESGAKHPVEIVEAAAAGLGVDAVALRKAVCCALSDTRDYVIGQILRVGPQGGCAGNVLTLTVDL